MRRKPFKAQVRAMEYARKQDHPAFFLEMRTGKTLPTIRILRERYPQGNRRGLVVAPLSAVPGWEWELEQEGEESVALLLDTPQNRLSELDLGSRWNIVNWAGLRVLPELTQMPWDWVVLDESVRIRNPRSQVSQLACNGFRNVPTRMILSGAPRPETDMDYFCQFIFLDGKWWDRTNYWQFRHAFFRQAGYDWVPRKGIRNDIKQYVADRAFWCSAAEAGMDNKIIRVQRYVEPTSEQLQLMAQARDEFEIRLEDKALSTQWRLVVETWLARLAGGFIEDNVVSSRKVDLLLELLTGELAGRKVVVWFRFNQELEKVSEALAHANIQHVWITGEVPWDEREHRRKEFNETVGTCVFLAQIKCATYGVDLSAADYAVYYSMVYSADEQMQTEARIKHPAVHTPRCLVHLLTRGSLDEVVFDSISEKKASSAWYRSKLTSFLGRKRG